MDIFQSIFGTELSMGMKLVIVTLILVAVLLLIFWIIRKITSNGILKTPRGRQPRLAVTDAASMDEKRRLVLVRRDNVEHLVMIGGATDVLIESNIIRNQPVQNTAARTQPAPPAPVQNPIPAETNTPPQSVPVEPTAKPENTGQPVVQTAATIAAGALAASAIAPTAQAEISQPEPATPNKSMHPAPVATPMSTPVSIPASKPEPMHEPAPISEGTPKPAEIKISEPAKPEPVAKDSKIEAAEPEIIPEHTPKDITLEIAGFAPDEKMERPVAPKKPQLAEENPDLSSADEEELSQSAIANLEDALGSELSLEEETIVPEDAEADNSKPKKDTAKDAKSDALEKEPEDEMQKLLNELAGEKA